MISDQQINVETTIMKFRTSTTAFCLFILFIILRIPAYGQTGITLTLNIASNPSPYISDWSSHKENASITVMAGQGVKSQQAKFKAELYRDEVLIARTKLEAMPIVTVPAGIGTQLYFGESIFPYAAIDFIGKVDADVIKTGMLPAGSYKLCLSLMAIDGKRELTGKEPVCRNFILTDYELPTLLFPENNAVLKETDRPAFRWTPVTPQPKFVVKYHFMLYELLEGQKAPQALKQRPLYEKDVVGVTQMPWPTDYTIPSRVRQCVWTIKTIDEKGIALGARQGMAEPFGFTFASSSVPDKIDDEIMLIAPQQNAVVKESTPVFQWTTPLRLKDKVVSYTMFMQEIAIDSLKKRDMPSGKFREYKDIKTTTLQYARTFEALNPSMVYIWGVSAYDQSGNKIAQSQVGEFTLAPVDFTAWWFAVILVGSANSTCVNTPFSLPTWFWHMGCSVGTASHSINPTNGGPMLNWTGGNITGTFPTAGKWTYQLIKHCTGSCGDVTKNVTIYVYPIVTGTAQITDMNNNPISSICYGNQAKLTVQNSCTDHLVNWSIQDNPGGSSLPIWMTGCPINTNIIPNGYGGLANISCTSISCLSFIRTYTAVITYNGQSLASLGLPPIPSYLHCLDPITSSTQVVVWCKTIAGSITGTPQGTICSDQNPYPVAVNLSLSGKKGNVLYWTCDKDIMYNSNVVTAGTQFAQGLTTISNCTVNQSGQYNFTVTVQNGDCPEDYAHYSFTIIDPPAGQLVEQNSHHIVCPSDHAVLQVVGAANVASYEWFYCNDCNCNPPTTCTSADPGPPWIKVTGSTGNTQNTNIFNSNSTPHPVNSQCWMAKLIGQTPCGCMYTNAWNFTYLPKIISVQLDPHPYVCCTGHILTATVTGGTQNQFTYKWMKDGDDYTTTSFPVNFITPSEPGIYSVTVSDGCYTMGSNTVKVCKGKLELFDCCVPGSGTMTLHAQFTSCCPSTSLPITFEWTGWFGTQSHTVSSWTDNLTVPVPAPPGAPYTVKVLYSGCPTCPANDCSIQKNGFIINCP
jgi:hypothetical protein